MSDSRMIPADEARVSAEQATLLMSLIDPHQPPIRKDWDDHLVYRLAHTVVAQAEQIKRLQEAVEHALYYSTEFTSDLIQEGIILPDDMEELAEVSRSRTAQLTRILEADHG